MAGAMIGACRLVGGSVETIFEARPLKAVSR